MNDHTIANATKRRLAGTRRPAARLAGLALLPLLFVTAVAGPAQAAGAPATATATATVTAVSVTGSAGATWSQVMRRKLTLEAGAVRIAALLPGLRTNAAGTGAGLARAQRTQRTTATIMINATAAQQNAYSRYVTARTAAAAARKAVGAAQKRRPRSVSRVARARRALTAADAAVLGRAATAVRTASALTVARTGYASATRQATIATTAYQHATGAVSRAERTIRSVPRLDAALAAQAAAISEQAVTQTRAGFTTAQTTQVYGITVNKIVAYPFQLMIDNAAKAGIRLSGGGFRTKQRQVALRTINGCPDIWTALASSCRVPTAIPGRSLHELGLAIDLTSGAKTISDRRSPAFKWLAANAGRYGFANLPSEPWHWSITGH
jgi:D-alanyl-D-alanine carboxypeptidase